jgi:DNA-binding transcriptional MerR regulator
MWSAGLPIEVPTEYVGWVQEGDQTIEMRKEILNEQRVGLAAKIAEIQKNAGIVRPQN